MTQHCSRCRKVAPIEPGTDPNIPPQGWIPDENAIDRMVCGSCASAREIVQFMEGMSLATATLDDLAGPRL